MAEVKTLDVTPPGFGERLIASYLVVDSERSALIETGPRSSLDKLVEALDAEGVTPDYIIVTHIHLDHAGAAGTLAEKMGKLVIVHPRGYKHLLDPTKLWNASQAVLGPIAEVYGKPDPVPKALLTAAGDSTILPLGESTLRIVHTPGHASHHMSILLEPEGVLFTGDSAGVSVEIDSERVRLPTTPPPVKPEFYIESIDRMILHNPRRIAPTHYDIDPLPATVYLKEHKEMFQEWLRAVGEIVEEGVTDLEEVAKRLAERIESAAKAYNSGNPIIVETFYKSTVWGLLDYHLKKK